MRSILSLFAVASAALGAVVRKDSSAGSDFPDLVPLNDTSNLADHEVLFYEDPNFKGAGWGLTPIPNQPSSQNNPGQFCYFVQP